MANALKISANELRWAISHLDEAQLRVTNAYVHFGEVERGHEELGEARDHIETALRVCRAFLKSMERLEDASTN